MYEFLERHRDEVVELALSRLRAATPDRTDPELADGLEEFVRNVEATLRREDGQDTVTALPGQSITAARHGRQRYQHGFDVLVVVRDYGAVCDSISEAAIARNLQFTARETQLLNRCVDAATSTAIDEYWHESQAAGQTRAADALSSLAQEIRTEIASGRMAFRAIQSGSLGLQSRTAGLVDRSFRRIEHMLAKSVTSARLDAQSSVVGTSIDVEVWLQSVVAGLARERGIRVYVSAPADLTLEGDLPLLSSAVSHLVQNAVTYSKEGARVEVRAYVSDDPYINIDVSDECGGLPPNITDELFIPYFLEGGRHEAPPLGLSIAQRAAVAHHGEVIVRNLPGQGCVFRLRLPRSRDAQ